MSLPLPLNSPERAKAIAELLARRAARGMADPLNRLRAIMAEGVANGAEIVTEQKDSAE